MKLWRVFVKTKISMAVAALQWPRLFGKWTKKYIGENPRGKVLVREFARKFVPKIKNLEKNNQLEKSSNTLWRFWDTGLDNAPEIIRACIRTTEKNIGDLDYVFLDLKNMGNYVDMPGYIFDLYKNGKMRPAHFTDMLRVELLYNHGGIWLDATGYMTSEIPKKIRDLEFFMFHVMRNNKPTVPYVQNCFIRADKNSLLLKGWRELCLDYWKHNDTHIDYFVHQIMFYSMVKNDQKMAELYAKMPMIDQKPTHHYAGHMSDKFNMDDFVRISKESFFQKLFYKPDGIVTPESNIVKIPQIII